MDNSNNTRLENNEEIFNASFSHRKEADSPISSHSDNIPSAARLNGVTLEQYNKICKELKYLDPDEQIVWIGRSSQLIHLGAYIVCFLFFWLIIPLFIAYFLYLKTKNTIYVITPERLHEYSGILTKRIDDLELYRVKDTAYIQPITLWFFHLSSVSILTSDPNWGESVIPGIKDGMMVREKLRRLVEEARDKKGVKEVDYYAQNHQLPTNSTL